MAVKINNLKNLSGGAPAAATAAATAATPKPTSPVVEALVSQAAEVLDQTTKAAPKATAGTKTKIPVKSKVTPLDSKVESVVEMAAPKAKIALSADVISKMSVLADRVGLLSDQVDAINKNPIFAEYAKTKAELDALVNEYVDPEDTFLVQGTSYDFDYSACSKSPRKIVDMQAVHDILGHEAFLAVSSVSVTTAAKYLSGKQIEEVCAPVTYTKTRKAQVKYKG